MTQEDKDLILKDLCSRLPYGVIGEYSWKGKNPYNRELTGNLYDELNSSWSSTEDSQFIPYLRPLSSMTEEECKELGELSATIENVGETLPNVPYYIEVARPEQIDWLNKKMFDYRGLIPKGLAIEVTEENNPYKTELS